jgi:mono/diheme cytochrome c family protein
MKRYTVFVGLLALASSLAWGQGADLFKTKCAVCHGAGGEGKGANPALKGVKLSQAEIASYLTKGGGKKVPHTKPIAGMTEEQATAVAGFVKSLK